MRGTPGVWANVRTDSPNFLNNFNRNNSQNSLWKLYGFIASLLFGILFWGAMFYIFFV